MKQFILLLAALALLSACGGERDSGSTTAQEPASMPDVEEMAETVENEVDDAMSSMSSTIDDMFDYTSAFARDDRMEEDYEQYDIRKSAEVLAFTGIRPGMTVVELEAGGGVYTELFSKVVGNSGKVYMQNPAEFDSFVKDAVDARLADNRLANVEMIKTPFDKLAVGDSEADIVTWILGPHELWYTPEGAPEGVFGDPAASFADIARVLKSGGVFIALDHQAPDGAPASTGGDTHRIDKAIIIDMAENAGLELMDESDLLENEADDKTVNVFDESVRRKTDRFLLKFRKT